MEVEEQLVEESRLSVSDSPKQQIKFYNISPEISLTQSTQSRLKRRNTLASKLPYYSSKNFQISSINRSNRRRSSPMRHRQMSSEFNFQQQYSLKENEWKKYYE